MALLAHQAPKLTGTPVTYSAAAAGGDTMVHTTAGALRVKNASAGAVTVTVVTPGNTRYGQADPDIPVVVSAGTEVAIGPFPDALAVEGILSVTYSAVASVTVAYS